MDLIKRAVVPVVSFLFVLGFSIFAVATLVTAVNAHACSQRPDLVGSCGEHFESVGEAMYYIFMGTLGHFDFHDLVGTMWSVSPAACIIIMLYMPLIYLMVMTVLPTQWSQKAVETTSADMVEEQVKQIFQEILRLEKILAPGEVSLG